MACPMAFGPRLDCGGGGRGAGTGCPYHWPVGCRLRRGRSGGDGLRAVGWFPPAIDGVQQTELKAVVQEFPAKVGLDLANWTLRQAQEEGGAQICAGTFRGLPKPQQLPELPAPLGICAETAQEASAQSRRSPAGDLRGGVCRPGGRGAAGGSQGFLRRRGPLPGRC